MSLAHEDGMTLEEVAARLGMSRARVQQIEAVALRKMRVAAGAAASPAPAKAVPARRGTRGAAQCRACGARGHYRSTCPEVEAMRVGIIGCGLIGGKRALLKPITERIEWMSVESAEMAKHALNAFLATSIAFINEIAELCTKVGADARDVERALKSEPRIGPKAYLTPGGPYEGGTLARDVGYLRALGEWPTPLIDAIKRSNDAHRRWMVGQ